MVKRRMGESLVELEVERTDSIYTILTGRTIGKEKAIRELEERISQLEKLIPEETYTEITLPNMTLSQLEFLKESLINAKADYSYIQQLIDEKMEKLSYNNVLNQLFD